MNENKTLLQKFRCCILQNFPFIEEDFDSLTTYELICKVVEYLNNTNIIEKTPKFWLDFLKSFVIKNFMNKIALVLHQMLKLILKF